MRDLPHGAKEIPEKYKGEEWAYLGVNVNEEFSPVYIVPPDKKKQVTKLKDALKESSALYLATDEDREGEAISWHLHEILKPKVPVHRLVFHEITEEAIQHALEHTREIDDGLGAVPRKPVASWIGSTATKCPLCCGEKFDRGLSAGRVQSVAVRLIVDREKARRAFVRAAYWDLLATFTTSGGETFEAQLVSVDGRQDSGRQGL